MSHEKDPKALSQQRFARFAPGYVTSQVHAKGHELNRLVEIARPQTDWAVLDVATGGGHTALKFAPLVASVVATDITPQMVETARAHITGQGIGNVAFEPADAENLPFEDERFDLVTCRCAPHHFPDCRRFVAESTRVLKPGGALLVQDQVLPEDDAAARYINAFEKLRDPSHNRAFPASQWLRMFQQAGLSVEHTEQIIKPQEFIAWAQLQGCTPETITRLASMAQEASPDVAAWMQPRDFGTPQASFVIHHIIILGRKGYKAAPTRAAG